jgi:cell division protein FtsN
MTFAMKNIITFLLLAGLTLSLLHACGPSEEELREQERARQQAINDSLALVYEAQLEQMRLDSIEQARQTSIAEAEARPVIEYSERGRYTVQIEAWRSENKARAQARRWQDRGFDRAYVVQFGDERTGEVWYRVRLGRFDTEETAKNLKDRLETEYNKESWISLLN